MSWHLWVCKADWGDKTNDNPTKILRRKYQRPESEVRRYFSHECRHATLTNSTNLMIDSLLTAIAVKIDLMHFGEEDENCLPLVYKKQTQLRLKVLRGTKFTSDRKENSKLNEKCE